MKYTEYLYFVLLGFLFPSNFIGALLLAFTWELFDTCFKNGTFSYELLQSHILGYKNKEQLIKGATYFVSYYIGHYIRNKFPL